MPLENIDCPCGSRLHYRHCCQPAHAQHSIVATAEKLMRSRYCAYVLKNYQYLLDTYATEQRSHLSVEQLSDSDQDTQWLSLQIVEVHDEQVEFIAYYQFEGGIYRLHERSNFIQRHSKWYYLDGDLFDDTGPVKLQRNDTCVCQSGKKFKKCCGA